MLRKIMVAALAIMALVWMLPMGALAEAGIDVSCTPAELAEPGKVSADVTIRNTSDSLTMEDVLLEGPRIEPYSVGNIVPRGTRQLTIAEVTIQEPGKAVNYRLSWTENGERKEADIPVLVKSKNVTPKLIATRKSDKEILKPGEKAMLTYVIQNQGEVSITDIKITDPAFAEAVAEGLSLEVGAEAKTISKELTMGEAAVTSAPTITYNAAGTPGEVKIEPIEIKLALVTLEVSIEAAQTSATGTKVVITLKNAGNLGLTKLLISDELGNEISSNINVAIGETKSFEHVVSSAAVRRFQVNVSGVDAQEQPFSVQSEETLELKPMINPAGVQLAFDAVADTSETAATGRASITFTVTLSGDVALQDAVIMEESVGEIMKLGVLNAGTVTKVAQFNIPHDTQLRFSVKAVDAAGNPYTQAAKTLDITLGNASAAPTESAPTPANEGQNQGQRQGEGEPIQGTLLTLIIVIGVLLAAAIVALAVLLIQDRKGRESRQDEMDELEEMLESPKLRTKKLPDDDEWDDDFGTKPKFKLPRAPTKPTVRPTVRPSQGLPEDFLGGQTPSQSNAHRRPAVAPIKRTSPLPERSHAPAPEQPSAPRQTPTVRPAPRSVNTGVQPPYQPPIMPSHDSGWDELDEDL